MAMPDTSSTGPDDAVNAVGYTSQITAAFRAVEMEHSTAPIINDPLARYLGRAAWQTACKDWQQLVELQGPGKSLRVPARNRLMDDLMLEALQQLSSSHQAIQVVNIGCGMDSKPWRLHMPLNVTWFDVDQPGVIQTKQQLLQEAGAASTVAQQQAHHTSTGQQSSSSSSGAPPDPSSSAATSVEQAQFPLLVDSWQAVPADLSQTSLASCFKTKGFDSSIPTVWVAEALLYYLTLDQAFQLLADMRALSVPGSKLIATCIDKELHVADHERIDEGHYFHAMWHFSIDELLQEGQQRLQQAGWKVEMEPRTTAELAQERYGRATYVAVYGGAECVFELACADCSV